MIWTYINIVPYSSSNTIAEWNDALNLSDPDAESVFVAMGFGFMLKEMAALICHVTSFKTTADVKTGRGDIALNSLLKVFPDHPSNPVEKSGATPFTLTSSYSTNPDILGKAGRPWLTGTQAWAMRTIVEGLLGVQRIYGGLPINPAFPSSWDKAECTLKIENAEYRIQIMRQTGSIQGVTVKLNGAEVDDGFIPFQEAGVYEVQVNVYSKK